jgi:hypothetical protein
MKKIISYFLAVLLLAVSISAQGNSPELIDELSNVPLDELMARIDNLAVQIGSVPNSKALIRIYGGWENSLISSYNHGAVIKAYVKNNMKLSVERFIIQFCNINNEPISTKFFILRETDKLETCDENFSIPKETTFFTDIGFYSRNFKLTPLEDLEVGFGLSDGEYWQSSLNILKRLLNDAPENKVYLIAYLKTNFDEDGNGKLLSGRRGRLDKKSDAQKMIQAARKELLKNGFSASQIVAIDGGYVDAQERRLEFWFVPQGGEIPKPKPDYIPKRAK